MSLNLQKEVMNKEAWIKFRKNYCKQVWYFPKILRNYTTQHQRMFTFEFIFYLYRFEARI